MENTSQKSSPIIVVGRPRSGSTLFTRLLGESSNLCVINDFYYLQYVDSLGGFSRQDSELIKSLAEHILFTLKDRQEPDENGLAGIECKSALTQSQIEDLERFVAQCSSQQNHDWASLFATIMKYNASLFGKEIWGYNTPQDYLHIPKLQEAYPDAKFIFVMRDPRAVMRSYKYLEYKENYHDPARYHPILQAIAWKSAMESYKSYQHQDNFMLVKYEDIVSDTNKTLTEVGGFIGVDFPEVNLKTFGNNSTFQGQNKVKKELSNTEIWICEKMIGEEMQEAGYSLENIQPSLKDIQYMSYITARSFSFYLKNSLFSSDIRKRVLKLAKTKFGGNSNSEEQVA